MHSSNYCTSRYTESSKRPSTASWVTDLIFLFCSCPFIQLHLKSNGRCRYSNSMWTVHLIYSSCSTLVHWITLNFSLDIVWVLPVHVWFTKTQEVHVRLANMHTQTLLVLYWIRGAYVCVSSLLHRTTDWWHCQCVWHKHLTASKKVCTRALECSVLRGRGGREVLSCM